MLQEFSFSRLFIVLFGKLRYTSTVSVMSSGNSYPRFLVIFLVDPTSIPATQNVATN